MGRAVLGGVNDQALLEETQVSEVHFANGDSDSESIRDYDAGPGLQRWHRRDQYFYRREENVEGQTYRRRMKLIDNTVPWQAPIWTEETEADADGYVRQKSFIEPSTVLIDEVTGEAKGLVKYEDPHLEAEGNPLVPAWRLNQKAIEFKIQQPPTSAEPDLELRDQWLSVMGYKVHKLEELWMVINQGHDPLSGGLSRDLRCVACGDPWKGQSVAQGAPEPLIACVYCNGLVHEACKEKHDQKHIEEDFYKGLRRREEGIRRAEAAGRVSAEAKEKLEASIRERGSLLSSVPGGPIRSPATDATLEEFHETRTKFTAADFEVRRSRKRKDLQGDTSDEEGLEPVEFCSSCGSARCWMEVDRCKSQEKSVRLKLAIKWLGDLA